MTEPVKWAKPRDAAAEAVVWAAIEDVAKKRKEDARNFIAQHLRAESMRGVDAIAHGTIIGSVTRSADRNARDVLDMSAFLEYLMEHQRNALQVPYQWKNAFLGTLEEVETDAGVVYVDADGHLVPGVGIRTIQGQVKVNKAAGVVKLVAELIGPAEKQLRELTEGKE